MSIREREREARSSGVCRVSAPRAHAAPRRVVQGLFVNVLFTTHIVGLPAAESEALLAFLNDHMQRAEFTCRFLWRPDSVAIWDNRITQHRPVNDYWPAHRKLQRITIDGDRPFA